MKRIYFVNEKNDYQGFAVVAENANQAKGYVRDGDHVDCDWIDTRVSLLKDENGKERIPSDDLPIGHIYEAMEGLKAGIYSYLPEYDCPVCGEIIDVYLFEDGSISCEICQEENKVKGK
jgi:hypothetical protein